MKSFHKRIFYLLIFSFVSCSTLEASGISGALSSDYTLYDTEVEGHDALEQDAGSNMDFVVTSVMGETLQQTEYYFMDFPPLKSFFLPEHSANVPVPPPDALG